MVTLQTSIVNNEIWKYNQKSSTNAIESLQQIQMVVARVKKNCERVGVGALLTKFYVGIMIMVTLRTSIVNYPLSLLPVDRLQGWPKYPQAIFYDLHYTLLHHVNRNAVAEVGG